MSVLTNYTGPHYKSYARIKTHSELVFFIDWTDYKEIRRYKWQAEVGKNHVYVSRRTSGAGGQTRVKLYLHNELMNHKPNKSTQVDHINGNSLDYRRSNLEIVPIHINVQRSKAKQFGVRTDPFGNVLPHRISYMPKFKLYRIRIGIAHYGSYKSYESATNSLRIIEKTRKKMGYND